MGICASRTAGVMMLRNNSEGLLYRTEISNPTREEVRLAKRQKNDFMKKNHRNKNDADVRDEVPVQCVEKVDRFGSFTQTMLHLVD